MIPNLFSLSLIFLLAIQGGFAEELTPQELIDFEVNSSLASPEEEDLHHKYLHDFAPENFTLYVVDPAENRNPLFQQLIDESIANLVLTPTGSQLCRVFGRDGDYIRKSAGVKNSKRIVEACSGFFPLGTDRDSTNANHFPRVYFVDVTEDPDFDYKAWSTKHNKTLIVIPRDYLTEGDLQGLRKYLLRVLAHEFAILYDQKCDLWGDSGFPEMKALHEKGAQAFCPTMAYLRHPLPMTAFALKRAWNFELTVAREAKESWPEIYNYSEQSLNISWIEEGASCLQAFEDILGQIIDEEAKLSKAYAYSLSTLDPQYQCQAITPKPSTEELHKIPEHLKPSYGNSGQNVDICDFMSKPSLGLKGVRHCRGPGPRTGGSGVRKTRGQRR